MTQIPAPYDLTDDERFQINFSLRMQLLFLKLFDNKEYKKQFKRIQDINNEKYREKRNRWISNRPTPPFAPPKGAIKLPIRYTRY